MLLLVVLTELCGEEGDPSVWLLEYVLLVTVLCALISEGRYCYMLVSALDVD